MEINLVRIGSVTIVELPLDASSVLTLYEYRDDCGTQRADIFYCLLTGGWLMGVPFSRSIELVLTRGFH